MDSRRKTEPQKNNHYQQLIEQLLSENTTIKTQYDQLKKDYHALKKKYDALSQQVPREVVDQIEQQLTGKKEEEPNINSPRYGGKWDQDMDAMAFEEEGTPGNSTLKPPSLIYQQQRGMEQTFMNFRNTRSRSRSSSMANQKSFPLIDGCFIIEKKPVGKDKSKHLQDMIEFSHPEELAKKEKHTMEFMLKYTLQSDEIVKVQDDQFSSRRNQISYGTPYEDYTYAFEDSHWNSKNPLPEILKQMGTLKKKYYHIIVRPEILQKDQYNQTKKKNEQQQGEQGQNLLEQADDDEQELPDLDDKQFYETEVIYCFISSFPLRSFFQDLHRIIQQELKYRQFNENTTDKVLSRKEKYKIIAQIMTNIYEEHYRIGGFPIFHTFHTGVSKLELAIPTLESYHSIQDDYLRNVLPKYNIVKICKLLHYTLAERFVIIEGQSRRSLNELFEVLRIILRPFLWTFATVYIYSDYFEPFLSSPMPILIGKLLKGQDEDSSQQQEQANEDHSDFVKVTMDSSPVDIKDKEPFSKSIKRLRKQLQKQQDKVVILHRYVSRLRSFIEKGVLDQEPTDFHMEFMDTQMVSYFKDCKEL